ncbi:MAG: TonB-dependent receptor [Planctomycetota bacterium]
MPAASPSPLLLRGAVLALALFAAPAAAGQATGADPPPPVEPELEDLGLGDEGDDFTDLDLEDLLEVECTVVSRRAESIDTAAGAVYVITGDEIRRAGHTTIQEALRLVPGTFVSRWRTSDWDVTIRGFGPGLADTSLAYLNQVLVMVDGVVVYTPLFAGTWWGLQDIDMEHVERIEVIRGPSGILWGANAFHGLINVVTKTSEGNEGQRVSARVSGDDSYVTLRSTELLEGSLRYSAFLRRTRRGGLDFAPSSPNDGLEDLLDWGIDSAGLRFDGTTDAGWAWRFDGRGYETEVGRFDNFGPGAVFTDQDDQYGGQASFTLLNPDEGLEIRSAYVKDKQRLFDTASTIDLDHFQFEARRDVAIDESHDLQYGIGYDLIHSFTDFYGGFATARLRQDNFRAFIADTVRVTGTALTLSYGVQAIYNEFSGFDVQPSGRFAWAPEGWGNFWGSVSRAVRTPSIEEEVFGQGTFDTSEKVVAFEAGWRGELISGLSLDVAGYYNDYDDVRVRMFNPVTSLDDFSTRGSGFARGVEVAFETRPTDGWTIRGSWSFNLSDHSPDGVDPQLDFVDAQYPVHLANLRSYVDLAEDWELDTAVYVVERFDEPGGTDGAEYWRADARVGWDATEDLRFAVGVQGLNDPRRSELGSQEVRRLVYVSVDVWR